MPIKIKRKNGKVTRYKNAEYIPLFYFLPKSLLDKCGELPFRISRYPYELFTDWKQIELIESDQFALLMYDAFHYLVWEYMGLNVGREIYSGDHPAWKFSHAPSFWIKTMLDEGVLPPIESLVNDIQPATFFGFVSDEYVDAVLKDIVPKTMERCLEKQCSRFDDKKRQQIKNIYESTNNDELLETVIYINDFVAKLGRREDE